jgi:hypothetical protein
MELLYITDPKYGSHDPKYRVSVSFCRKLTILRKTVAYHLWILSDFLKPIKTHIRDH